MKQLYQKKKKERKLKTLQINLTSFLLDSMTFSLTPRHGHKINLAPIAL